ncbi:hypothetical protein ACHAW5_002469 [Stephanodiscus triporus]|uniref:Uncharacterized protein n=1 Tax=Stephanodiscus triporus TaxID=2934178 RepID=A0ABD3QK31_9STRA
MSASNPGRADGAAELPSFRETARAQDAGHTVSIAVLGVPYSRCHDRGACDNGLGQLGRGGSPSALLPIALSSDSQTGGRARSRGGGAAAAVAAHAYAGGFADSGHSAILDASGHLWLCGCDRWQQLGLGSSNGGSTGYAWGGGKPWQDRFRKNAHVADLLRRLDPSLPMDRPGDDDDDRRMMMEGDSSRRWIRDVALGGDHTVVLSSNGKDVIAFGKGSEGQLGLSSRPFVSSPAKSKILSSGAADISAVCAYRNCSMTLDVNGEVLSTAGKCSLELQGMKEALDMCRERAQETGLIIFQNQLLARLRLLSVPRIKSIDTSHPLIAFRLSRHPSRSAPARNANVENRLRPSWSMAARRQLGVHSSPRSAGFPTKFRSENFRMNRLSPRREYHQNNLPTTPDSVRYDLRTSSGSAASRKKESRGGEDITTFVNAALKGAVVVDDDDAAAAATWSAIGEHPPLATMIQLPTECPSSASLFASYSAIKCDI